MLPIEKVDHIGIRVSEKQRSIAFYEVLGFKLISDTGFEHGHPIIMQHQSGVVLNLLGPTNVPPGENVLMDIEEKHSGITHVSYKVRSLDEVKAYLAEKAIELTGQFSFDGLSAVFIRDPDRNVIELDYYEGQEPGPRKGSSSGDSGYEQHPD